MDRPLPKQTDLSQTDGSVRACGHVTPGSQSESVGCRWGPLCPRCGAPSLMCPEAIVPSLSGPLAWSVAGCAASTWVVRNKVSLALSVMASGDVSAGPTHLALGFLLREGTVEA